jgi:hypothetical protein
MVRDAMVAIALAIAGAAALHAVTAIVLTIAGAAAGAAAEALDQDGLAMERASGVAEVAAAIVPRVTASDTRAAVIGLANRATRIVDIMTAIANIIADTIIQGTAIDL